MVGVNMEEEDVEIFKQTSGYFFSFNFFFFDVDLMEGFSVMA